MATEADGLTGVARPKARAGRILSLRLPSSVSRRLGWGVADQAVSSLTNFAVTIYMARVLGATQFGAFSLAYVTYSFVLNASRGLATDPLMVRFSGAELPAWRRAVARCTGTATVVGLFAGACVLLAAVFLSGATRDGFLALGLTLPGLMLQDSWRFSFFALGRGSQAFLNDTIWAVAMAPALFALHATGHADVFWFVFAWGAAAGVGALCGPLQARVIPQLTQAWSWVRSHRDLGPRYLAENTANSGASQLRLYCVGFILGLAAVGYVQAASTLMGPFLVVFMGMSLVIVPEAVRVLNRAPHRLRLFSLVTSSGLAAAGMLWGVVLLVALPRGLGHLLLGNIWRPAYPLVLPLTVSVAGGCASAGATAGLHALGAARRSLRAMVIGSVAYLVLGVAGAVLDGAFGTVCGVALATWFGALAWWWQLHAGLREAGLRGAGQPEAEPPEAELRQAELRQAELRETELRETELREAGLREARIGPRPADLPSPPRSHQPSGRHHRPPETRPPGTRPPGTRPPGTRPPGPGTPAWPAEPGDRESA